MPNKVWPAPRVGPRGASSLSPACVQQVQFHIPDLTDANQLNAVVPGNFSLVCVLFQDVPGNVSFVSFFQRVFFCLCSVFGCGAGCRCTRTTTCGLAYSQPFQIAKRILKFEESFSSSGSTKSECHPSSRREKNAASRSCLRCCKEVSTEALQNYRFCRLCSKSSHHSGRITCLYIVVSGPMPAA